MKIDKLFTIDNITSAPTWGGGMDQIWRWDTKVNKWAKYGYQKPARTGTAAWRKCNYETDNSFSDLTDDDVVMPGETFMYMRGGGTTATLTLAGQVREFGYVGGYTISKANYQFIAYPWPIEFKIADIGTIATFSSLTSAPTWGGGMDQIWRWDTKVNKWAKYGYQKPARTGTAAWRKCNYETDNSFSDLTDDDKIAAGEGFLYMRGGGETLTLTWKELEPAE